MKKIILFTLFAITLSACNNLTYKHTYKHKINDTNALDLIQEHYKFANELTKLSIESSSVSTKAYQSYDYRKPDSMRTANFIELDEDRKQFYSYSEYWYPGGFNFTFREFQKGSLSVVFDDNGVVMGKNVKNQGPERIKQVINQVGNLLDFKWANKLFSNDDASISKTSVEDGSVIITLVDNKQDTDNTKEYTFLVNPIRLKSVQWLSSKAKLVFDEYVESNNITYASKVSFYIDGEFKNEQKINSLKKIEAIAADKLIIPDGYTISENKETKELKSYQIADNLYLIKPVAGDRNVMFKVNDDGISVFGAPIADSLSNKVMKLINDEFPDKKIKDVYITHYHNDHIGGLAAYAKKGVLILADEFSIQAIKDYPRFKEDIKDFKFKPITHKEIINGVEYFIPGNTHSFGQSFVYFVDSEIIYQADFLEIPADNTIPTQIPDVSLRFIEFIRNEKLAIKRIVGHHRNDNIPLELINEYYKRNHKE